MCCRCPLQHTYPFWLPEDPPRGRNEKINKGTSFLLHIIRLSLYQWLIVLGTQLQPSHQHTSDCSHWPRKPTIRKHRWSITVNLEISTRWHAFRRRGRSSSRRTSRVARPHSNNRYTAWLVCITAIVNHIFISLPAIPIYEPSYIHLSPAHCLKPTPSNWYLAPKVYSMLPAASR